MSPHLIAVLKAALSERSSKLTVTGPTEKVSMSWQEMLGRGRISGSRKRQPERAVVEFHGCARVRTPRLAEKIRGELTEADDPRSWVDNSSKRVSALRTSHFRLHLVRPCVSSRARRCARRSMLRCVSREASPASFRTGQVVTSRATSGREEGGGPKTGRPRKSLTHRA